MRIAGVYAQPVEADPRLDPDPEEPLGIEYVLAAASRQGHEVRLFSPLDAPLAELPEKILQFRPDVACFSVFTKQAPRSTRIAARLKDARPGVYVVAGGPHPTADPNYALEPAIDACVLGEGEATFCELLDALGGSKPLQTVPGLLLQVDGDVVRTAPRGRLEHLDSLPLPLREHRYYEMPGRSISYPPLNRCNWRPVLFSRGCTMPCSFCSSRDLWGGTVTFRSPGDVLSELRFLQDAHGVNSVFFEDLTFTLNRPRFTALCELLVKERLRMRWACETHVNTVDAATLGRMREAGCMKILWGIESLDDPTLERIQKKQKRIDAARSLHMAAECGILNWGCCIIGFPWETEDDILRAAERLPSLDIHQLRISIATPFPGSQWHKELPPAALHPDLSLYDTNHLVYDHPTISPERMKELQNEVFRRFYRSPRYRNRVSHMVRNFPHLRESFDEWLAYIEENLDRLDAGETELTRVLSPAVSPREEVTA